MGSDPDTNVRMKADQQLQEIDKKYPGFIQVLLNANTTALFELGDKYFNVL